MTKNLNYRVLKLFILIIIVWAIYSKQLHGNNQNLTQMPVINNFDVSLYLLEFILTDSVKEYNLHINILIKKLVQCLKNLLLINKWSFYVISNSNYYKNLKLLKCDESIFEHNLVVYAKLFKNSLRFLNSERITSKCTFNREMIKYLISIDFIKNDSIMNCIENAARGSDLDAFVFLFELKVTNHWYATFKLVSKSCNLNNFDFMVQKCKLIDSKQKFTDFINALLHNASSHGNYGVVVYLGQNYNNYIIDYFDPLKAAATHNHLNVVKYLVAASFKDLSAMNNALTFASMAGNFEIVRYLVTQGANSRTCDDAALYLAVKNKHYITIKYLLDAVLSNKFTKWTTKKNYLIKVNNLLRVPNTVNREKYYCLQAIISQLSTSDLAYGFKFNYLPTLEKSPSFNNYNLYSDFIRNILPTCNVFSLPFVYKNKYDQDHCDYDSSNVIDFDNTGLAHIHKEYNSLSYLVEEIEQSHLYDCYMEYNCSRKRGISFRPNYDDIEDSVYSRRNECKIIIENYQNRCYHNSKDYDINGNSCEIVDLYKEIFNKETSKFLIK